MLIRSFLAALLIALPQASFSAEIDDAEKMIQDVIVVLKKMNPDDGALTAEQKAANEKDREIIGNQIDIDVMTNYTLGKFAQGRSLQDMTTFKDLFKKLVVKSASVKTKADFTMKIKKKETVAKKFVITTQVKKKGDDPVELKYSITRTSAGLRIVDLIIDGESIMDNYKSQFSDIINKKGFPELLNRLRKQTTNTKS